MVTVRRERVAELLEASLAALDRGDPREACERLREAWRLSKDPGLADGYALWVRELQAAPLAGGDPSERAASWLLRAEQAPGDPRLLPVLLAEPWDSLERAQQRLDLLEPWSPDPLLAEAVASWLRLPAARGVHDLRDRQVLLLDAQLDPRQLVTLAGLLAEPSLRSDLRGLVRGAHARLERVRVRPLAPPARAVAARIDRRAEPRRGFERRSDELLAAVRAEPTRDEPRWIYADWLTAHGDPRGELIALQLERASTEAAPSARERELLAQHEPAWTGPLHAVLGAREFARGFLHAGSVELPEIDGEIVTAPEWSTLAILDGHVSDALARRGPLDHLVELYGYLRLDRFLALRADSRLGSVRRYECSLADPNVLLDTPIAVESLLVRGALDDALIRLAGSRAIVGLVELGVYYSAATMFAGDHRERRSARHRVELLADRLPVHVRRLRLIDDSSPRASRPRGWVLTLERDEHERFTRARVDRPEPSRPGPAAVAQLLGLLDEVGLGTTGRVTLGQLDEVARAELTVRLGARLLGG